ncbi:MAG: hypothetical protein AB7O32_00110 [Vicinamibacterales bacterium]
MPTSGALSVAGRLACRAFARGQDDREFVAAAMLCSPARRARDVAREIGVSAPTVRRWRRSFAAVLARSKRMDGLRLGDLYAPAAEPEASCL